MPLSINLISSCLPIFHRKSLSSSSWWCHTVRVSGTQRNVSNLNGKSMLGPNPPSSFIDDEENGNSTVVWWSHAEIDKRLGNKAAESFCSIHPFNSIGLALVRLALAQWYAVRRRGLADRFEFIVLQERSIHWQRFRPRPRLITDKLSFLSTSAAGETLFCSQHKRKPLLPKCLSKRFANQQKNVRPIFSLCY